MIRFSWHNDSPPSIWIRHGPDNILSVSLFTRMPYGWLLEWWWAVSKREREFLTTVGGRGESTSWYSISQTLSFVKIGSFRSNFSPNNKRHQIRQICARSVRSNVQFLGGRMQAIHPERGIPEPLGPGGIPPRKGSEEDLFPPKLKSLHPHLVGVRSRFVGLCPIGAEDMFKCALQPSVFDARVQHSGRKVGEKCQPNARSFERCEGWSDIRPGFELQIRLH